jgi:hypothetical protein
VLGPGETWSFHPQALLNLRDLLQDALDQIRRQ